MSTNDIANERRKLAAQIYGSIIWTGLTRENKRRIVLETMADLDADFPADGSPPAPSPIQPGPEPVTPPPAGEPPLKLNADESARYLQTFLTEFNNAGITTPEQAAAHWAAKGRTEWLAGDPNRRRFTF